MTQADSIHELLPWYLNGTLEAAENARFETHLAQCDSCRKEMAMLKALQGELGSHGRAYLEPHPAPDELIGCDRGELTPERDDALRKHLELCESCAEEFRWIAGSASFGGQESAPLPASRTDRRPTPIIYGLLATAALLALALPLVWMLKPSASSYSGVVQMSHVQLPTRGEQTSRVVTGEQDDAVYFVVEIDLPEEEFPVDVALLADDGTTLISQSDIAADLLLERFLYVKCATQLCPVGDYTLRVSGKGEEPPMEFRMSVVED